MRRWHLFGAFCTLATAFAPSACSSDTCLDTGTCAAADDAGGGTEGGVKPPADCDLTKSAKESPACVADEVGVFVSPTGVDSAPGTKAAPVKTINAALGKLGPKPRVYVCEGTYDGNVEITTGVAIVGGLTCAWAPADVKPKIAPPKGIALKVTKVTAPVVVESVEIVGAADAAKPGDSAIAAFVSESANVTFKNASLSAGAGTPGAKGEAKSNYSAPATPGGLTNTAAAGVGPSCTCADGNSSHGGVGTKGDGSGGDDGSAKPAVGTPNSGSSAASSCTPGTIGTKGLATLPGEPSASAGVLATSGWDASAVGVPGGNGNPAQGGGGGGARKNLNLGGGGGGCGGCGGAGGGPGGNGGSSFAVLSYQSTVNVEGGALSTAAGGAGGEGGTGQDGQAGGAFGEGGGCNGGPGGGAGAGGSGGGGGAGGHSAPLAFAGPEPRVNGAKLQPGTKGGGGPDGKPGAGPGTAGTEGKPGPEGKAQNTLAL